MPTHAKIGYTVPAVNAQWLGINTTTTRNSAWVPMTAIPRPSTTFFCYWDSTMDLTLKRLYASIATSLWDVTAYLQLANAAGTGIISFPIGVSGFTNHDSGNALANMSQQHTWSAGVGTLTQARVQITLSRSNFYSGCDVTVDVAAGTLWVYYESTDPVSADVIAHTDAGASLPRLHVVSAGAAAHRISKFRYRFAQTMADAGDWSGTPIGTTVYRLPSP